VSASWPARLAALPSLGLGVSTEYGASVQDGALDVGALLSAHPSYAQFLEVGVEVHKGLDDAARAWAAAGRPSTYHFLDINLDEPEDFDAPWLSGLCDLADALRPAWLCGDAGLWHFGPRDRAQMLLLPPILCDEAATDQARGIARLREATGREVLPENPPGHVFLGDLHLLDFFSRVLDRADTGMLLDCAHLAIYQRARGHSPLHGLDAFPLDRVVEVHIAGGSTHAHDGYAYIEDDHRPEILPETWQIASHIVANAPNLRAVVYECERNPLDACLPGFSAIESLLRAARAEPLRDVAAPR
jgi:uncharacterized protein (UPF0276 family)